MTLAQQCESAADLLDELAEQFTALEWTGHAKQIVYLAGHLRIYRHQLEARAHEDQT
jgi:hypothetical protein